MPDANGRFRGISVPDLPWLKDEPEPEALDAEARLHELEEAAQPFVQHPRWCSIGAINNTAEVRVTRAQYERLTAALSSGAGA